MENQSQSFPYKIRVKLGEDEYEFQSPDKETFEKVGLEMLKKTFGRYQGQENKEEKND